MLDERFEAMVTDVFERDVKTNLPQSTINSARQYWQDYIKPSFKGPLDDEGFQETPYRVPLPGVNNYSGPHFHEGYWFLDKFV